MEENENGWGDVTLQEKVEYEIEEDAPPAAQEAKPEVAPEAPKKEEIKELDGIETNGAQKRIRQLVKQRKEREEEIQALLKEKQDLQERLSSQEQSFVDTQKTSTDVSEQQLNDKVAFAKSAYLDAYNSGDGEKVLQTLEVLQRSQLDLDNLSKQKAALEQYTKAKEEEAKKQTEQPQQPTQARPDPRAEEWAAENEWFGKDSILTASALAVDAELKQQGYNPDEEDFYGEIDRRLREEFPHKFTDQEVSEDNRPQQTTPAAQVVAGASRSPATSTGKKIKLSQEDVRLANKWNIPLEVYAAEKLKVDGSDGEYTDVSFGRGS